MQLFSKQLAPKTTLIGMSALGIICLIIGVCLFFSAMNFKKIAVKAEGTVQEFVTDKEGLKAPVISFKTADGKDQVYTSNVYSGDPENKIGDKISILYNPKNPEDATVEGSMYLAPIILLSLGAFILTLGFAVWILMKKKISFNYQKSFDKTIDLKK